MSNIIDSLCMTWRHDYGLHKKDEDSFSSGMTTKEREALQRDMKQIYEHHIKPLEDRIRELETPKPFQTDPCPGMNCGCTDGVSHSPECRAETAATYAGGWFVKGLEKPEGARPVAVVREDHDGTKHAVLRDESLADGTLLVAASAVEDMIAACVPGGSICDPQVVADAIRGYFAAQPAPAASPAILTSGQILALERRSGMTDDEALRYARSVESAVLRAQAADESPETVECMGLTIQVGQPQPAPATGDERAAFERFAESQGWFTGYGDGEYEGWATQWAWLAWQASAAHRREDQRVNPGDEEC